MESGLFVRIARQNKKISQSVLVLEASKLLPKNRKLSVKMLKRYELLEISIPLDRLKAIELVLCERF